jgi:hypothetical protein
LSFSPWIVDGFKNMLTLSVFDPNGFRGAGHRHGDRHEVILNEHYTSPGYVAGSIPPGAWTVVVDTHLIMPGAPCIIRLQVSASDEAAPTADRRPRPTGVPVGLSAVSRQRSALSPASRGRGWYRGDLHAHTIHSDASWDIPDLLAWARTHQLDFVTLSDHNTISGLEQMDAASSNGPSTALIERRSVQALLTISGIELTTFWGHALALGLREWVDWRVREGERTIEHIAAEVSAGGGSFVIAHPASIGDPYCTGCRWVYADMLPGTARIVEAWNGAWVGDGSSKNEDALSLIYSWLKQGHRLVLTAGTDHHGHDPEPHGFNVVYAEDLTEREILSAIRAGHSYLSSGPNLELSASAGEERAMMGDVLDLARGTPIHIRARWDACPGNSQLNLIIDGAARERLPVGASGSATWELPGGDTHWCLLTLRDQNGTMLALTNPIFFEARSG